MVGLDESSLWAPGVGATIVGWGDIEFDGEPSNLLLEAQVPIRTDAVCASAYGTFFDQTSMLCAGAAAPASNSSDSCQGDSGGPLLVPDGPDAFALAGVISTGFECNRTGYPGIYARIGDNPLNSWVHSRFPRPTSSSATGRAPTSR